MCQRPPKCFGPFVSRKAIVNGQGCKWAKFNGIRGSLIIDDSVNKILALFIRSMQNLTSLQSWSPCVPMSGLHRPKFSTTAL